MQEMVTALEGALVGGVVVFSAMVLLYIWYDYMLTKIERIAAEEVREKMDRHKDIYHDK